MPLAIVEIGGDGDDGLANALADMRLGPLLQFLQDHGRDLRGRIGFLTELDPDHSALFRQVVGEVGQLALYVLKVLSHESLHGINGPFRVARQMFFRRIADDEAVVGHRHDRGNHPTLVPTWYDTRTSVRHIGHERIRCTEINADDTCHGSDYPMVEARSFTMFLT